MKSSGLFMLLVLLVASMAYSCLAQIHYTPDWGHGKRSLGLQFDVETPNDGTAQCMEQTELNLLLEVVKILTKEAKRLSICLKECPSVE